VFQPESYSVALFCMIFSMFCWGSWANTVKLCPGYRFQLYYWDYIVGLFLASIAWGMTLGTFGGSGRTFLDDLLHADANHLLLAFAGGVIFNVANLLLVAAIDIAGLAVAFPVGIGIALVVGAVSSYAIAPAGNPWMLFGGVALVLGAIAFDAMAYHLREKERRSASMRGVMLSLGAGILMGTFYPFVAKSMAGENAPGPYAISLIFALGVIACSLPMNYLLMRKPLDGGARVSMAGFTAAPLKWHLWGILGGAIWCTGAVLNFVASRAHIVGPAVSYSIGQGATMVSACWGVFIWREFAAAPARSKRLLISMFLFFIAGLSSIALAPIFQFIH
jgi:glucose uptake protein